MTRPTRDDWAMSIVDSCALRTTCIRGHGVGCVLLDAYGHVLSTGYNGVPPGDPHCNEIRGYTDGFTGSHVFEHPSGIACTPIYPHACAGHADHIDSRLDSCRATHAEANAILQCRDVHEIETCYSSLSPCVHCVKLLRLTSCKKIIFKAPYIKHHDEALRIWMGVQRDDEVSLVNRKDGVLMSASHNGRAWHLYKEGQTQ